MWDAFDETDTLCAMTGWGGPGWQDQPGDQQQNQQFNYQDPAQQQQGWPGGFQQPAPLVPTPQGPPPGSDGMIGNEPVMVTIGDISVTATTVYTPSGSRPLSDVQWTFTDMSTTSQSIPTWAIVCAIVFFLFCLLGLLFLLAKENTTTGAVQVTVHGPGFVHTSTMPVSSAQQVADLNARVNYVRTLAASTYQGQPQLGQPQLGPGQPGQGQFGPGQFGQPPTGQPGQAGQSQPEQFGQAQPGQQWPPQQGWDPTQQAQQPGPQDQQPGQGW
jgi:hypothetical protein